MAHRIYNLDASYWRTVTGALTTSGLFSSNTDAYVLNPAQLLANGLGKDSSLSLNQLQSFRMSLGSSFSISGGSDWLVSSWNSAGFGSSGEVIKNNYDLFIENQISGLALQLNPASLDFTTLLVSGTISGSSYFIPIMVFASQGEEVVVTDITAPSIGTGITFSDINYNMIRVNWGAATDAITAQPSLQYRVLRANSTALLDSVSNANSNGTVRMNWTSNVTTFLDTGLTLNTSYAYAVLVRDSSGNTALYPAQSQSTLADTTAPTVGTISYTSLSYNSVFLEWSQSTDNVTPQLQLEYKLYRSSSNNISSIEDAETNGTQIFDWSGVIGQLQTGLSPDTTYYYVVLVRDVAGNQSIYPSISITTTSADTTAPTPGTGIIFSSVTGSSMTVQWGAATDNVTSQTSLQYKLLQSLSNNMDTVVDAETNGSVVMGFTEGVTNYNVTGLSDSTTYYFSVIVRDSQGNKSLYTAASQDTTDTTAPIIGTQIIVGNETNTTVDVSWGAATDNYTPQNSLEYKLVYSTSNNIGSISNANSNGVLGMDWSQSLSHSVTGLTSGTLYYFAVIVRDAANNVSLYSPVSTTTAAADTTPPNVSSVGIYFGSVAANSIQITWDAATDNITSTELLEYKVFYSLSDNISNFVDAELYGSVAEDWTANLGSSTITGLSDLTLYYFNVFVRDQAGNVSAYNTVNTTTLDGLAPNVTSFGIAYTDEGTSTVAVYWMPATDNSGGTLEYKLYYSASNNLTDVTSTEVNGAMAMDWQPDIYEYSVSPLLIGVEYWFNLLVRDESGNISQYGSISTTIPDTMSPSQPSPIEFTNIGMDSVDVSWGQSVDLVSSSLEYRLYYSAYDNITSLFQAEANGTLLMDWSIDTLTFPVASLQPATDYWFLVAVRDAAGNTNFNVGSITTAADSIYPVPPSILTIDGSTDNSISISWSAATDNYTPQSMLEYLVVYSLSNNLDGVYDSLLNGNQFGSWTSNITSTTITGLTPGTTYYFNVLVRDEAGNISQYGNQSQATTGNAITISSMIPGVITGTSVELTWGAAVDNHGTSSFNYELYYSTSDNITTYADTVTNGIFVGQGTDMVTYIVTGLQLGTVYYFAVIVTNNMLANPETGHAHVSATTLAEPVISATFEGQSVSLNWDSTAAGTYYRLYYSDADNISTVGDAELNGTLAMDWALDTYSATIIGLFSPPDYYFTVVTTDNLTSPASLWLTDHIIGPSVTSLILKDPSGNTVADGSTIVLDGDAVYTFEYVADRAATGANRLVLVATDTSGTVELNGSGTQVNRALNLKFVSHPLPNLVIGTPFQESIMGIVDAVATWDASPNPVTSYDGPIYFNVAWVYSNPITGNDTIIYFDPEQKLSFTIDNPDYTFQAGEAVSNQPWISGTLSVPYNQDFTLNFNTQNSTIEGSDLTILNPVTTGTNWGSMSINDILIYKSYRQNEPSYHDITGNFTGQKLDGTYSNPPELFAGSKQNLYGNVNESTLARFVSQGGSTTGLDNLGVGSVMFIDVNPYYIDPFWMGPEYGQGIGFPAGVVWEVQSIMSPPSAGSLVAAGWGSLLLFGQLYLNFQSSPIPIYALGGVPSAVKSTYTASLGFTYNGFIQFGGYGLNTQTNNPNGTSWTYQLVLNGSPIGSEVYQIYDLNYPDLSGYVGQLVSLGVRIRKTSYSGIGSHYYYNPSWNFTLYVQ